MFINLRLHIFIATMFVAFIICGCQSPNSKWGMASSDRAKNPSSKNRMNAGDRSSRIENSSSGIAKKSGPNSEVSAKSSEKMREALNLMEQGDQLRKSGQYEDARIVYHSALEISPESTDLHHRLAIIADKQQKYSVADEHYQAALRARPNDVNILSDLGYSYSLRGNTEKAEKSLKQALSIDPTHRGALANLGTIYAQQNRYPEALAIFRKGSASEGEAKQSVAKLFSRASRSTPQSFASLASTSPDIDPSGRRKSIEMGETGHDSAANAAKRSFDADSDISTLTSDQLKAELARRDWPSEQRKSREKSWDDSESDGDTSSQIQATQDRSASKNSEREMMSKVETADTARGKSDSQVFQARGQAHDDGTGAIQQTGSRSSISQIATQVGMNSGPANLFPILSLKSEGIDSAGAAIPRKTSQGVSQTGWRDNLQNSVSWESETLNTGSSGQGFDSTGRNPLDSTQRSTGRADRPGGRDNGSLAVKKNGNDAARPYNGAWPKTNEIPGRQNQSPFQKESEQGPSGFENFSANLGGKASTNESRIPRTEFPGNSRTQWPDAPN